MALLAAVGTGVAIQAPGGLGVGKIDILLFPFTTSIPGVTFHSGNDSSVSSLDVDNGGSGKSGSPFGGGGVSNSGLTVLEDDRGGVDKNDGNDNGADNSGE